MCPLSDTRVLCVSVHSKSTYPVDVSNGVVPVLPYKNLITFK